MLCFTLNLHPYELADSMVTLGEPRDWLGVGKRVPWALDTSNSSKHSWRAVVGQTSSFGGSDGWVTRPVTFLGIYNFGLKYEKGIILNFLGFFFHFWFFPILSFSVFFFFSSTFTFFYPFNLHLFPTRKGNGY